MMNGHHNGDAALVRASSRILVPCTIDQYVDLSKVSEDFRAVNGAIAPVKLSARRIRDKGVSAPMIRASLLDLTSESQTSTLKGSGPKPNGGETEASCLRVIQSLRFLARLCHLHVGEPQSTAEHPRDEC